MTDWREGLPKKLWELPFHFLDAIKSKTGDKKQIQNKDLLNIGIISSNFSTVLFSCFTVFQFSSKWKKKKKKKRVRNVELRRKQVWEKEKALLLLQCQNLKNNVLLSHLSVQYCLSKKKWFWNYGSGTKTKILPDTSVSCQNDKKNSFIPSIHPRFVYMGTY